FAPGSEGQKIQALYGTFMDWDKRNADGFNPIKNDLARIDGLKSIAALQKFLIEATKTGDNPFYAWRVSAELKNSNMNAVYFGGPSLGLGRDYYQKESESNTKTLAECVSYISRRRTESGHKNAGRTSHQLVDSEKKLARNLLTNEQSRDANLRYNPRTGAELPRLVKNISLADYLNKAGV